jgi:hypothetical protein
MKAWQIVTLAFTILGWLFVLAVIFGVVKVSSVRADIPDWQEEFEEEEDWHITGVDMKPRKHI